MAVQTKTLLNDVGSAVVAEVASQLNRAAGYVSTPIGHTLVAGDQSFVLCKFTEDVFITNVEFGFGNGGGAFNQNDDAVDLSTGADPDGTGGTIVLSVTNFDPADPSTTFPTSDVWATMAAMQAVAGTTAIVGELLGSFPIPVDAGDALAMHFLVDGGSAAGGAVVESINVTYRPVKDALNVAPVYVQTMRNFSSTVR